MGSHIQRVYIPKKEYNDEFKKCHENGKVWSDKLAILTLQLIDNHMSSNTFRFNRGYDMRVFQRVKDKVVDKLLSQLMDKFKYEKGGDPFSFTGSMIRWWAYKYVLQEAKKGLNPDLSQTYYDKNINEWIKISFISAF